MNSAEIHFIGLMVISSVSFSKFCDVAPKMLKEYMDSISADGVHNKTIYPAKYILPLDSPYITGFVQIFSDFRAYNAKKIPSNYSLLMMPDKTFSNMVSSLNSNSESSCKEINFLQADTILASAGLTT